MGKGGDANKIGFFDSGLGGQEILNAVRKHLPQYNYLYYGDTAHVPYGDKTETQIYELTKRGVIHLFESGAKLVILACNTASAETARKLQHELLTGAYGDRKILGVIIPTVETITEQGADDVILLATKRTVDSQKYDIELKKLSNSVRLTALAAPELVPLLENNEKEKAAKFVADILLSETRGEGTVVMACTHYSLVDDFLDGDIKEKFSFVYQTEIIPQKLATYLEKHPEITEQLSAEGTVRIHFTKNS